MSDTPSALVKSIRAYNYALADDVEKLERELAAMTEQTTSYLRQAREANEELAEAKQELEALRVIAATETDIAERAEAALPRQPSEYICKCGLRVVPHCCSTTEDF